MPGEQLANTAQQKNTKGSRVITLHNARGSTVLSCPAAARSCYCSLALTRRPNSPPPRKIAHVSVLIVEGLTGTGKTSTIAALRTIADFRCFGEESTFDDFVEQYNADRETAARRACARMSRILDAIESDAGSSVLLERFHFSQLAVGSERHWYEPINARCVEMKVRVAILTIADSALTGRALYRAEYENTDWQGLIESHGSQTSALEVLRRAQERRIEAVAESGLEYHLIDTTEMLWKRYATQIAGWMNWRKERDRSDAEQLSQ